MVISNIRPKIRFNTLALAALGTLAVAACDVDAEPPASGGVGAGDVRGRCGRGVAVVTSDYTSTNVVIADLEGNTLSPSFVSSGATKPGLALALSGDVDVPTTAPVSGRVVTLDRFGSNVLTWLNLETAEVEAQLSIGTGFEANPQDYLEVDGTRAYVSRYGSNLVPGREAFDEGGDLLIVDHRNPTVLGRIAMPEDDARFFPRPSALTRFGETVMVTLQRLAPDFALAGDGRLVGVTPATDSVAWTLEVAGLASCGKIAVSPNRERLALACSGVYDPVLGGYDPAKSDVILYDARTSPPTELRRYGLGASLGVAVQAGVVFASEGLLLAKTAGGGAARGDRVYALDVDSGAASLLHESAAPFALGSLWCSPGCGDVCLVADSEAQALHRYRVSATGALETLPSVTLETEIGLPPRSIGPL